MSRLDDLKDSIRYIDDHVFIPVEELDQFQTRLSAAYHATTQDGSVDLMTYKAALRVKQAAETLLISMKHWDEMMRESGDDERRAEVKADRKDDARADAHEVEARPSEALPDKPEE